jgi:hypothetical protein
MKVKTTQQTTKQHAFWRKLYIRLLTEEPKQLDDLTPEERALELGGIEDLVDAGYIAGHVAKDASGIPQSATTRGPTLAGRIFAEEQQDILNKSSIGGRIKSGAGIAFGWFFGWITGIISALIIWWLTK